MNSPAAEITPINRSIPVVELANVSFTWPEAGGARRFGISVGALSLSTGSRTLLLGPSGGGKSTLLSLLGGIVTPSSGTIRILDADFTQMSNAERDRFRAEHIGVLFQMFNLLPYGSVIDNVLLPLSFAPRRQKRARDDGEGSEVNAAKRILSGFGLADALLNAPAATLSVGQQQRVAAARALIGSPELIIADEPTSALDRKNQDQFIDRLFAQLDTSGSTLMMVTHDERLTSRFDSVLQLTDIISEVEST